tara:strand:- start:309 stop:563 length:255 start_codon:yes stop_codon:yes gene_type:complete
MNKENKKYIIMETRVPAENEFIFCDGFSETEEKRRMWDYLERVFGIAREYIPSHLISKDNDHNRMTGFRIIKLGENDSYRPYND